MVNADRIRRDIIVLGASAGGVLALIRIFEALPADFPASVGAVLHRSPVFNLNLAMVLGRKSRLSVIEPSNNATLKSSAIYLAPRDHHMLFRDGFIHLNRGPKEHFTRPAIDPLFNSASAGYGRRVLGVLLTGGNEDGVSGLIAIKQAGGLVIAQDPNEAQVPIMPLSAVVHDHVDLILPLAQIPAAMIRLANGEVVEAD